MIIDNQIQIKLKLFEYQKDNKLKSHDINYSYNNSQEYINCALYDTTLEKTKKILCKQQNNNNKIINCNFL